MSASPLTKAEQLRVVQLCGTIGNIGVCRALGITPRTLQSLVMTRRGRQPASQTPEWVAGIRLRLEIAERLYRWRGIAGGMRSGTKLGRRKG